MTIDKPCLSQYYVLRGQICRSCGNRYLYHKHKCRCGSINNFENIITKPFKSEMEDENVHTNKSA